MVGEIYTRVGGEDKDGNLRVSQKHFLLIAIENATSISVEMTRNISK